jgi:hypothetical protein
MVSDSGLPQPLQKIARILVSPVDSPQKCRHPSDILDPISNIQKSKTWKPSRGRDQPET